MNKEFNLELCMTRDGGRCKTRDGQDARIICTDRKTDSEFKVIALVTTDDGEEGSINYTPKGEFSKGISDHKYDLVNLPTKKQAWINVYEDDIRAEKIKRFTFDSKEKAEAGINPFDKYIKTILLHEWKE